MVVVVAGEEVVGEEVVEVVEHNRTKCMMVRRKQGSQIRTSFHLSLTSASSSKNQPQYRRLQPQ